MKETKTISADVLIIGAGPAGALAASLLVQRGYQVVVIEKSYFPRFSIGESLLPQCMEFIERAGLLADVQAGGFQFKNGAAFSWGERYTHFDFTEKFSAGWGTTFQVERGRFDKILADGAERQGAVIHYGRVITNVVFNDGGVTLSACNGEAEQCEYRGQFVLDASGFGRVLPRLLELDRPSDFPVRKSIFTHIEDRIDDPQFDREKILITVHPEYRDVWYWLIPFSGGRCSVGVVAEDDFLQKFQGSDEQILKQLIQQAPFLNRLLKNAQFDTRVANVSGYSADVSRLYGEHFALLGNAGEFLDPVFSSGVTIAMKSAGLAADVLDQQLRGGQVNWQQQFVEPLQQGINTFKACVQMWYEGKLQDIFFFEQGNPALKAQISSILAGYAWDRDNPFVKEPRRRLEILAKICAESPV